MFHFQYHTHTHTYQVKDITESVFNRVPKKHHINCGFTVIELLSRGEEVIYNLLAEVIYTLYIYI